MMFSGPPGKRDGVDDGRCLPPFVVFAPLELLEDHPHELAVLQDELFGCVVDDDLDFLFLGVVELPG